MGRDSYRPGERVQLVYTTDTFTALLPGTRGTVVATDSLGTVHVAWDDGSTLGITSEDVIQRVGPCDREHRR